MKKRNFASLAALLSLITAFMVVSCKDPSTGGEDDQSSPKATVTRVTVSAAENAISVNKGGSLQFSAVVNGTNSPSQAVTWSISTAGKPGTTISTGGLLTVASDEALLTLTVRATSAEDTTKSGVATVTVNDPSLQNLSGDVTIRVAGSPVTTATAGTQLTANYGGTEGSVSYQWNRDGTAIDHATLSTYTPYANGSYTVIVSLSGYNPKISTVVIVTGETGDPLDNSPVANRWTKEIAPESTATLDLSVASDGVCTMIVGGVADSTAWHANAHYLYTPEAGKNYTYVFEAWTESGTRTLGVQCFYDDVDTVTSMMLSGDLQINSTQTTYTLRGGTIPKNGVRSLQFHCANQTGTFYVKVISITPYAQEDLPVAERWHKEVNSESTATLDYEVDNDGVCKITVGGTPMQDNAWRTQAQYSYTAKANTHYVYEFEAWTQSGGRNVWVEYYYDNVANSYNGSEVSLGVTRQTYRVIGETANSGVLDLRFQCADQAGTFYVKMLGIYEITDNSPTANRWTKQVAPESIATLDFSVSSDDVCNITVGGVADSTRWHSNVHYSYTPAAGKSYTYVFEAWTESGTRTLGVQCYYDSDTGFSLMAGELTINSTRTTYTVRGGTIPKDGDRSLQFHCADQTGTFYVKVISITPYTLEDLPVAERWGKAVESTSATLNYSVAGDGVCTITIGGTADVDRWKAQASYSYTANANTLYVYEFEAWTQSGSRELQIQYYYDDVGGIYKQSDVSLTGTHQTYRVNGSTANGGVLELRFQCGDQLGTFYVKMLSINERTPSLEYELIDDVNSPNYNTYRVSSGTRMSGAVEIPDTHSGKSVTEIGEYVFQDCNNLTSIFIPTSVTSIGLHAFQRCTSLTSISIPASVTNIESALGAGCTNLTAITVAASNPNYSSTGGILYNKSKNELLSWPSASGNVTIPAGVTRIGGDAFNGGLATSVTIPASVTSVGGWTFAGWSASQTINIQGHASQSSADSAWGSDWRNDCNAVVHYSGQ